MQYEIYLVWFLPISNATTNFALNKLNFPVGVTSRSEIFIKTILTYTIGLTFYVELTGPIVNFTRILLWIFNNSSTFTYMHRHRHHHFEIQGKSGVANEKLGFDIYTWCHDIISTIHPIT